MRAVLVVALLLAVYFGLTFIQVWRSMDPGEPRPAEALVVLGAAQYNGVPSPVLEARLQRALDLYRQGVASRIVVTGGRQVGDRFTEATTGYNWLRRRGVPDSAILKEVQGTSTYESLAAAARFLRPRGIDRVVLVSSDYHSKRLLGIADDVGLHAQVAPGDDPPERRRARSRHLLRETVAVGIGRIIGYRRLDNLLD